MPKRNLFAPIDPASLVAFRVAFGGLLAVLVSRYFLNGWIETQYYMPQRFFTWEAFSWVRPWPRPFMEVHFAVLGLLALCIAAGFLFRWSALLFCLGFTYVQLIDKTNYLNHYYLIALLSLLLAAAPAAAHPHVFIDNRVTFLFDAGKVSALRLNWVFDDLFSDSLLSQFDADGDGAFDKLESGAVGEGVLPNLKIFNYFTYIWVDGKQLDPIDPTEFVASANGDRLVTFQMKVPLPQPVDVPK